MSNDELFKNNKICFDLLIKSDILYIKENANLTTEQLDLFNLLISDNYTSQELAEKLHISERTVTRIKKKLYIKISRVLARMK